MSKVMESDILNAGTLSQAAPGSSNRFWCIRLSEMIREYIIINRDLNILFLFSFGNL